MLIVQNSSKSRIMIKKMLKKSIKTWFFDVKIIKNIIIKKNEIYTTKNCSFF